MATLPLLEPGIFLHPRPKKLLLSSQPSKRRKLDHKIEQIAFDNDARADYLTGFHKRKVQRAKRAQEEAVKKEREEKVVMRKQLREERKQELEEHVSAINAALRAAGDPDVPDSSSDSDAWGGISDTESSGKPKKSSLKPKPDLVDHEQSYIDEDDDRYTTVTIEEVDVSKEGLTKVREEGEEEEEKEEAQRVRKKKEEERKKAEGKEAKEKKVWPKKPRKEKFRYESKVERKATRMKQKSKNKASADARKGS